MKVVYGKTLTTEENAVVNNISVDCGILFDTAKLLFYRNVKTVEAAKKFLNPQKKDLYNPFLLSRMKEAANRIALAKTRGESVLVFGDYDADGVCAASVLYRSLKEFGIKTIVTVPEREEGYGLNPEKVFDIKKSEDFSLLITVDCGISDREKIEKIKNAGIEVIVTDHHEPPEKLPDCITINPKIKGQAYPFDGLCGAGVAYKLAYAVIGEKADEYLDYVALATVADSMSLIDENRLIVSIGLKMLNGAKKREIFKTLMGEQQDKKFTSQSLAFGLAPRVNAGGRMGDAYTALKSFISDDENEIFDLSVTLNKYNISRQAECDAIYREAKSIVNERKLYLDSAILVSKEEWKTGFIGIVASKLVDDYNRPVIVFAESDGAMKGSARSVDEINIYDAIDYAKEFTIGFGGHSQAAGVTVAKDNLENFKRRVCEFVSKRSDNVENEKELLVDMAFEKKLSVRFIKELELLEPFGVGNRKPLFAAKTGAVNPKPLKLGSPHFAFETDVIEMLDFNGEEDISVLVSDTEKEIIFEPNYSVFRNKEYVKGFVRRVIPDYGDFSALSLKIVENELLKVQTAQNVDCVYVNYKDVKLTKGRGVLYLVGDERNLSFYDLSNLKVYPFKKQDGNNENCVILSAEKVPDGYDEIVYLDKPLSLLQAEKITVVKDLCGYNRLYNLSVDRSDFEESFRILNGVSGSAYSGAAEFYETHNLSVNAEQFVFAAATFTELGFFKTTNGLLKRNVSAKSPLDKSKIYNCICGLKKEYE